MLAVFLDIRSAFENVNWNPDTEVTDHYTDVIYNMFRYKEMHLDIDGVIAALRRVRSWVR